MHDGGPDDKKCDRPDEPQLLEEPKAPSNDVAIAAATPSLLALGLVVGSTLAQRAAAVDKPEPPQREGPSALCNDPKYAGKFATNVCVSEMRCCEKGAECF